MWSPTQTDGRNGTDRVDRPRRIPIRYGQTNPPRHRGFLTTEPDSPDWLIEADATAVPGGRVYVAADYDDDGTRRRFRGVALVLQQVMTWDGRMNVRVEFEFTSTPQSEIAELLGVPAERALSVDPDDEGEVAWASFEPDPDEEAPGSLELALASFAEAAVERITSDEEHRRSHDGETFREYSPVHWDRIALWSAGMGSAVLAVLVVLFLLAWPFA